MNEPKNIPLWIKLVNVPIKAWSVRGRFGYARVLVEVNVKKDFPNEIEICYRDRDNNNVGSKKVRVAYSWKPPICNHCEVFGHTVTNCKVKPVYVEEFLEKENGRNQANKNEFIEVQRKKVGVKQDQHPAAKYAYKAKVNQADNRGNVNQVGQGGNVNGHNTKSQGGIDKDNAKDKRDENIRSNNKFAVLENDNVGDADNIDEINEKEVVDKFNMNEDVFVDESTMGHKLVGKVTKDYCSGVLMNDYGGDVGRGKGLLTLQITLQTKKIFLSVISNNWKYKKSSFAMFKLVSDHGRRNQNHVATISDEVGNVFGGNDVVELFLKHFQNFLSNTKQTKKLDECKIFFDKKVEENDSVNMAPRPDGFTSKFFKKAWGIVGNDVCTVVKEFFKSGKLLKEVNATLIALIPKIKSPTKVYDFRPISCCNVIYKGYGRKNGIQRCAFKINQQKAYDTLCWNFFKEVLCRFEFPNEMVKWIMECVSTPFSLCVNGERIGYFKGGRGLRQGDPMYPYLFTLIMEVLNLFLKQEIKDSGNFVYHPGCKDLMITHLCFADDLLILSNGDVHSVKVIKSALDLFSACSGLQPNMKKSTLFCGSVKSSVKNEILKIMPFSKGHLPVRYLGVPLVTRNLIVSILSSMHLYCAQVFLLPKDTIYEIEKAMKGFLWCQVLLFKNLWNVAAKNQSLWIDKMKLKGRSLSEVSPDSNSSWGWKHLLSLEIRREMKLAYECYKIDTRKEDKVCIPKHSFVLWLAVHKRLSTQDRLVTWYPGKQMSCGLCKKVMDSHNHLFFNYIVGYIEGIHGVNKIWNVVRSLAIAATMYHIWTERNNRLFQNIERDGKCVMNAIIDDVRLKL
ncbi:RNA-directed DNA polymerase, eukaryota, reverse transcriptase zinc-binding domain protein [Tanacetum coccineum]